jgi:hypothetical protein
MPCFFGARYGRIEKAWTWLYIQVILIMDNAGQVNVVYGKRKTNMAAASAVAARRLFGM